MKGNSSHKLWTNPEIPAIIPTVIPSVNQTTPGRVATSGKAFHAVRGVLHQEIVTGATHSAADVLKYHPMLNRKDASGPIPQDRHTVRIPPRTTTIVCTGTGPSVPQISIGSHKIDVSRRTIIPQEVRNAKPLDAYINRVPSKHRDTMPTWSKVFGRKFTNESSADVYARCQMNLVSDTILSQSPNFVDFGLSSVDIMYELGSIFASTTRIGSVTHRSDCLPRRHCIVKIKWIE